MSHHQFAAGIVFGMFIAFCAGWPFYLWTVRREILGRVVKSYESCGVWYGIIRLDRSLEDCIWVA